jgi:hypothetical protein
LRAFSTGRLGINSTSLERSIRPIVSQGTSGQRSLPRG